jgi:hypothetical protein
MLYSLGSHKKVHIVNVQYWNVIPLQDEVNTQSTKAQRQKTISTAVNSISAACFIIDGVWQMSTHNVGRLGW